MSFLESFNNSKASYGIAGAMLMLVGLSGCGGDSGGPLFIPNNCQQSSALSLLVKGKNVTAFIANGDWAERTEDTGVFITNVEGTGTNSFVDTPTAVNSCATDPSNGKTVCTSNGTDVYLIENGALNPNTLSDAAVDTVVMSGGECMTCNVAIDVLHHFALLGIALGAGDSGYQGLFLRNETLTGNTLLTGDPFPRISESFEVDSARQLLLSASEDGEYQVVRRIGTNPQVFNFAESDPMFTDIEAELDSSSEDCTDAVGLGTIEYQGALFLSNLKFAKYDTASGTWDAPSQIFSMPELAEPGDGGLFTYGTTAIATAPRKHLGILGQEYTYNNHFAVFQLQDNPGNGVPTIVDYAVATIPQDPNSNNWAYTYDPHGIAAYMSPKGDEATGLLLNRNRTFLLSVNLQALLDAPRSDTHIVDPSVDLQGTGVISFVPVQ